MASDEELHRRVRAGDRRAFRALYDRHGSCLLGFLRGYVKSEAEAEDLVHETFVRVLENDVVFDRASFRTWLYRIGRNAALNRLRTTRRAEKASTRLAHQEAGAGVDEAHEQKRRLAALDAAVDRLPPLLAEVYAMRTRGLSYQEMADALEIPLGTLKSRMHDMVSRLRGELSEWSAQ